MLVGSLLTVDGVVAHCEGDGPVGLRLQVALGVRGGVGVVIFGLQDVLLVLTGMYRYLSNSEKKYEEKKAFR